MAYCINLRLAASGGLNNEALTFRQGIIIRNCLKPEDALFQEILAFFRTQPREAVD